MKAWALALAAAGILAGCDGAPGEASSAPESAAVTAPSNTEALCTAPVTREVAFTAPDAKDVLEIAAVGSNCTQASILTTIRSATGDLVWSRAESVQSLMAFAGADQSTQTSEQILQQQMKGWVETVEVKTSADAPDWKEGEPRPSDPTGLYIGTDFPRDEYLAAKAAKRTMLCHTIYMARAQCLIYFPGDGGSGYASQLFDLRS